MSSYPPATNIVTDNQATTCDTSTECSKHNLSLPVNWVRMCSGVV